MTILSRPGDCQFHMSLHKFIVEPSFFYRKAAQWQFCQAKANSHFISADCHFADGRFAAILSQANGHFISADGHVIKADGRFIKRRPSCQRPMAILSALKASGLKGLGATVSRKPRQSQKFEVKPWG